MQEDKEMILADKIIELRKKNGWSQEDLAEKLNVSRQSISKWEGAQSIPDMNKIIKMSEIFGVSTDFLLKDEMEMEKTEDENALAVVSTDEEVCELRSVSMDEANAFIRMRESISRNIAVGVMLCILSPIALILLGGMSEYGKIAMTEPMAAGAGLVFLFLLIGPAVALFIKSGMESDRYEYMEKELLDTEYGVDGMVRSMKERYMGAYTKMLILGIVLCVVSVLPIFFTMMTIGEPAENSPLAIYFVYAVCALLAMVALGVFLIVRACIIKDGYDMLLEEGDYTRKAKIESKKHDKITSAYWMTVTAAYLAYSFITNDWSRSWIIWPVAGVAYGIVIIIADSLRKK